MIQIFCYEKCDVKQVCAQCLIVNRNNFSKILNYATMYAEDWPNAGTFQYRMKGMRNPPTTHYLRYQLNLLIC